MIFLIECERLRVNSIVFADSETALRRFAGEDLIFILACKSMNVHITWGGPS